MRDHLKKIELYRDNLLLTTHQTVASYQADYATSKATLLTLLSSQRDLFELETMYYQDLSDYQIAQAELGALAGLDQKISTTGKSYVIGKHNETQFDFCER